MKIKKSQLKELIRQSLIELKFGSQAQYDAYKKKHDIKPGTKVKVGDKTTTHKGKAKMSKKAKSLGDKMADKLNKRMADLEKKSKEGKPSDDTGGPSYANVPKGAKSSEQAKAMKAAREKNIEKTDDVARSMGYKHTAEIVKDGTADEIGDFMDAVDDVGQNWNEID